jgi:hypothetical protein
MNKILKRVAEINDNCDLNSCIMEDKLMKAIEGIKTQNRWFMGIFATILVGLIITITTIGGFSQVLISR